MKVLFIHHSVGRYVLSVGELRQKLSSLVPAVELWDHDYNERGLSGPDGSTHASGAFPIPNDDTDVPALSELVVEYSKGRSPIQARLDEFDCLVLKSCYPNSHIDSDEKLEKFKGYYSDIDTAASSLRQPVVLLTSPPLVRERTAAGAAERARALTNWMTSDDTLPNVIIIDCFSTLAASGGLLRNTLAFEYRKPWPFDSHPNAAGSRAVAELVAEGLSAVLTDS